MATTRTTYWAAMTATSLLPLHSPQVTLETNLMILKAPFPQLTPETMYVAVRESFVATFSVEYSSN
jgi:hypothetical protein